MQHLTDLFKIIELTRSQPQYGYIIGIDGNKKASNLAEHHYLVAFIGWQLASNLKEAGANIDVLKVVEFCLIHDLGELFGGDISMHYAKINPRARKFAKSFEEENQRFISKFFGPQAPRIKKITKEILDAKSDEAIIAKFADYFEVNHFRFYIDELTKHDIDLVLDKTDKFISRLKDRVAKKQLGILVKEWVKALPKNKPMDILRK